MSLTRLYYPFCRTRPGHFLAAKGVRSLRRLGIARQFRLPLDAIELPHEALAGLMGLWPRIHWAGGDGMMPPEQLLSIYRLAAAWPAEGDIVELGAWVGLTTCYLATACRVRSASIGDNGSRVAAREIVHAVDTFEGTREGGKTYPSVRRHGGNTRRAFDENVCRSGLARLVRVHQGLTTAVAGRYDGRPIRLLLIDADHSYEGVRADFEAWSPYVTPGGLIVFHDYLLSAVARLVDEVLESDPRVSRRPGVVDPNVMAITWQPESAGEYQPSPAGASGQVTTV